MKLSVKKRLIEEWCRERDWFGRRLSKNGYVEDWS